MLHHEVEMIHSSTRRRNIHALDLGFKAGENCYF